MPKNKNISVRVNGRLVYVDTTIEVYETVKTISYEESVQAGADYVFESDSVEDIVISSILLERLRDAIQHLSTDEKELIDALFFANDGKGIGERNYAKTKGLTQKSITYRKKIIFKKLKQLMN